MFTSVLGGCRWVSATRVPYGQRWLGPSQSAGGRGGSRSSTTSMTLLSSAPPSVCEIGMARNPDRCVFMRGRRVRNLSRSNPILSRFYGTKMVKNGRFRGTKMVKISHFRGVKMIKIRRFLTIITIGQSIVNRRVLKSLRLYPVLRLPTAPTPIR